MSVVPLITPHTMESIEQASSRPASSDPCSSVFDQAQGRIVLGKDVLHQSKSIRRHRQRRLVDQASDVSEEDDVNKTPTAAGYDGTDSSLEKDRASMSTELTAELTMMSAGSMPSDEGNNSVHVRGFPSTPDEQKSLSHEHYCGMRDFVEMGSSGDNSTPLISNQSFRTPPPRRNKLVTVQEFGSEANLRSSLQQPVLRKNSSSTFTPVEDSGQKSSHRVNLSSRPKPKLIARRATAPAVSPSRRTNLADEVVQEKAAHMREDLKRLEMQELAAEAERAAESGLERFVGSASKFGGQTPPHTPGYTDDDDSLSDDSFNAFSTPKRNAPRKDLLLSADFTPSKYFNRIEKIPITALRDFHEIVPPFSEMHSNICVHLKREGANLGAPPQLYNKQSLINSNECEEYVQDDTDAASHVASQAGSLSSFSTQFQASLRGILDYVRPTSPSANSIVDKGSAVSGLNNTPHVTRRPSDDTRSHFGTTATSRPITPVDFHERVSPFAGSSNQSVSSAVNGKDSLLASSHNSISDQSKSNSIDEKKISFQNERAIYKSILRRIQQSPSPNRKCRDDQQECEEPSCAASLIMSPVTAAASPAPVTDFISKIQKQFTRAGPKNQDADTNKLDSQHFVSNFFYTSQSSSAANVTNIPPLKLDASVDASTKGFCAPGCGQSNSILPTCQSAAKAITFLFDLLGTKNPSSSQSQRSMSTDSENSEVQKVWLEKWERSKSSREHAIWMPPRLSSSFAVKPDLDLFYNCSPEAVSLGDRSPRQPGVCPEMDDIGGKLQCPDLV